MISPKSSDVLLSVPARALGHLLALRQHPDEPLADVLVRLTAEQLPQVSGTNSAPQTAAEAEPAASFGKGTRAVRYLVRVFDAENCVGTLTEVLAFALNTLEFVDPGILARLEQVRPRKRRLVARRPEYIHERDDLNRECTLEFRPGWFVGTNYSYDNTHGLLAAICRETGLALGSDIELCRIKSLGKAQVTRY